MSRHANSRVQEGTLEYINIVKKHEEIYNITHPGYKNLESKSIAWKRISEEINLPIDTCKRKWKNLRDSYTKYLRSFRTGTKTSRKYQYWAHAHHMDFLKPFQGPSRRSSSSNQYENQDNQMPKDEFECDLGYTVLDKISIENVEESICLDEEIEPKVEIHTENKKPEEVVTVEKLSPPAIEEKPQTNHKLSKPATKTVSFKPNKFKNNVIQISNQYKHFDHSNNFSTVIRGNKDVDSLQLFFLSLAKTVSTMPKKKQALIKMKCMKIITDVEIELSQNEYNQDMHKLEEFTYVMSPSRIEIDLSSGGEEEESN
ncbi:hypothetical protein ACFFRR_008039 [Megaselia abdita]